MHKKLVTLLYFNSNKFNIYFIFYSVHLFQSNHFIIALHQKCIENYKNYN